MRIAMIIGLLILLAMSTGCNVHDIVSDTNDGHFNLVYWTMDIVLGKSS